MDISTFDLAKEWLTYLFIIAFALAIISNYLVKAIMKTFFAEDEKVERFRTLIFFVVDLALLYLVGHRVLNISVGVDAFGNDLPIIDIEEFFGIAIFISAISMIVYGMLPQIMVRVAKMFNIKIKTVGETVVLDESKEKDE